MAERRRPADMNRASGEEPAGLYFTSSKNHLKFIHSGSTMLDNALGGGWVLGRVVNIVGDKSTGKTLLAIEAASNFLKAHPRGKVWYRERESAFDKPYAEALGMPIRRVDFGRDPFDTVEGFEEDLNKVISGRTDPGLYILDSLDSLSDTAELARKPGEASYGTAKAKAMSEMFRKIIRPLEKSQTLLMVISQIRDKIGVTFGKRTTRAGGHALDFYASHIVELAYLGRIHLTRNNTKRVTGIEVQARVSKNKIALPFRDARFDIKFGFGIDDLTSCMDWLAEVKRFDALNMTEAEAKDFRKETNAANEEVYRQRCTMVAEATKKVWREIENEFLPTRRKY